MKFKTFLFLLTLVANFTFAQNNIKVTSNYGSENKDIQNLIDFENIYIEQLNFEGKDLIGKQYSINLQEFKNGKLISKSVLFDGEGNDYFKIKSEKESLKFLFKMTDGKLKTYIRGSGFGSKKSYFNLKDDSDQYALKDFFGNKKELNLVANQETAVFAIITPTKHDDGSSSYCEVVQSDIKPENLGTHFKIPHYFLVTLQFK
ncbi:hypothetical protein BD847_1418 [Flavobacterium cutihirudinis]|uniref:GLPGLI family protein n=1 Tax=Flavobacterium cutihirudinis TaxID=1265740 RepID=A0A3D9FVB2_9FLAO|nr:hypothetical protein [Flavobacterium cutihirudinis]RED24683.1 hypothetical protein BD847_1418 [Flavobacterium cutihirudinis]